LFFLWLLTNYLQRAYHGLLIPLIGFFFLPLTTLAYAWMVNTHRPMEGVNLIIHLTVHETASIVQLVYPATLRGPAV